MKKSKIKKTLKTLTINRDKWGKQSLLTHDNKMCCLGFACVAIGYDLNKWEWEGLNFPRDIEDLEGKFSGPKWLLDNDWTSEAAMANDTLKGQNREDVVKRLFAEKGCKVRFIGGKKAKAKKAKSKK